MKIFRTDPDRFGIRARLLTLLLPAILGLLALDSWNDYRALRNLVQDAYDQSMLESATAVRNSLVLAPDGSLQLAAPLVLQAMFKDTGPEHKHLHVGLTPKANSAEGATPQPEITLMGEPDLPTPPVPSATAAPATAPSSPVWYDSYYRRYPVRVVALQGSLVDGHGQRFDLLVQVAESTGPRDRAQAASMQQGLWRDARTVLVVILLVWLGVTWSLHPLEKLRKSVLLSKGNNLEPLDTSNVPHEVAPLVDAINHHVASYQALLDEQSQFLADASHQLRTPLAIMLTQAGVALREKDPAQLHETLRAIVVQISRSRRLCEQLLSLAHASDSAPPEGAPEVVDLNSVAREVVLQYLTLAHEKNQDLGWVDARQDTPDGAVAPSAFSETSAMPMVPAVPVVASAAELHEVLSNLVHNAIVYTPAGSSITVTAGAQGDTAFAEVRDDGPGIAASRREEVFGRFRQAGTAHGKSAGGAGLGLAIARAYARRNGGDIELADAPASAGLRAVLRLPLAEVSPC